MRLALSALLTLLPMTALAHKAGISGMSGKTPGMNCGMCHSGGTSPTGSITGAPITLNVNSSANVSVIITAGSMATTQAGLDVSLGNTAATGSSLSAGNGTQVLNGEITHIQPRAFDAGITSFDFSITAGVINGPLTIYMAVNAVNGDNATTGDNYYLFNRTLQVTGTPPPPDAGPPDAGPPLEDGGEPPPTDAGDGDAGPRTPAGPPGGFVGGDLGCSTGGGIPTGAWLLVLGALGLVRNFAPRAARRAPRGN
jgi:hypothetical protein